MVYSEKRKCWCVHPTKHTNYLDVVDWCSQQWGWHRIDGDRYGTWSHCNGEYYGLVQTLFDYKFPDTRLYFSFDTEEDALMFALRWA